jgi:hypothetical protein
MRSVQYFACMTDGTGGKAGGRRRLRLQPLRNEPLVKRSDGACYVQSWQRRTDCGRAGTQWCAAKHPVPPGVVESARLQPDERCWRCTQQAASGGATPGPTERRATRSGFTMKRR